MTVIKIHTIMEGTILKKVYSQLWHDRKVLSQADFAKQTGFSKTPMSFMLNGSKPSPYRLLEKLYFAFRVNVNYIISNGEGSLYLFNQEQGQMMNEVQVPYNNAKLEALEKEVEMLRQQLQDKEKIIQLLEGQKVHLGMGGKKIK